jgi:hypothetical protein
VAQGEGPEFMPQYCKKKKKKRPRKRLGRYSGQGTEPKRMAELSNYK